MGQNKVVFTQRHLFISYEKSRIGRFSCPLGFWKKIDDISYSYIYEKSVNVKVYNQIIIISLFNSKIANINTNFYIMYRVF